MVLQGVTKVFQRAGAPVVALSEVGFSVEDRECLAIVGPSGSGKTTLLRLIGGLENLSDGTIFIGESVVNHLPPHTRDVAMVFQSPALYPHLSVFENLAFGMKLRKHSRADIAQRIGGVAEVLNIAGCLGAQPAELSGGQRQRVAIARALVRRASVLLLDEPLANLDPPLRAQLRQDIATARKKFGTTLLYVTHDHLEAMLVADRVAVLAEGKVQQVASPGTMYRDPANLFVAQFFGFPSINLFHGVLVQRHGELFFDATPESHAFSLRLNGFPQPELASSSGRPVILGIRPEHISCWAQTQPVPVGSSVQAKIASVQMAGADTYVAAGNGQSRFIARVPTQFRPITEAQCTFIFNTDSVCLFDPVSGNAFRSA